MLIATIAVSLVCHQLVSFPFPCDDVSLRHIDATCAMAHRCTVATTSANDQAVPFNLGVEKELVVQPRKDWKLLFISTERNT